MPNLRKKRTCGFFKWADEVDNVLDLQMLAIEKDTKISKLEYERDVLKDKVKKLKQTTTELEDQIAELAIENTEKFHAMELLDDVMDDVLGGDDSPYALFQSCIVV
ncbi:Uroporphyrinogen decarboxylase [Bienertia sinuspersici]